MRRSRRTTLLRATRGSARLSRLSWMSSSGMGSRRTSKSERRASARRRRMRRAGRGRLRLRRSGGSPRLAVGSAKPRGRRESQSVCDSAAGLGSNSVLASSTLGRPAWASLDTSGACLVTRASLDLPSQATAIVRHLSPVVRGPWSVPVESSDSPSDWSTRPASVLVLILILFLSLARARNGPLYRRVPSVLEWRVRGG